jgi:hypothetical protein
VDRSAAPTCWMRAIERKETMTKKLYEVHVEFTYYALADDARDAEWLSDDAFRDEDHTAIADATEITKANGLISWPGNSLVYGAEDDTTLDEALAAIGLPSVEAMKSLWTQRIRQASNSVIHGSERGEQSSGGGKEGGE